MKQFSSGFATDMKSSLLRVSSATMLEYAGETYHCVVGRGGFVAAKEKREGDLKTPIGTWRLRELWYRPDKLVRPVCALPTREISQADGWCDDPESGDYNRHVLIPPPACGGQPFVVPPPACGGRSGGGRFAQDEHSSRIVSVMKNARELRKNLTDAEQYLWMLLRRKQLGERFRRQHAIGHYIADFACLEKRLVIELDGGQHTIQVAYDAKREAFIKAAGFRILRFWNHEVFENTQGVLESIWEALQAPTPTLPRKQGRESQALSFSYERLWRDDDAYDLIVPLGYNDNPPVPGKGSAIFLHCARPDWRGTEGCVALAKDDLLEVLAQIEANATMEIALQ